MLCFKTEGQAKTAANHKLACLQTDVLHYMVNFVLQGTLIEELDLNAELTMSVPCSEKILNHFNVFRGSLARTKEKRAGGGSFLLLSVSPTIWVADTSVRWWDLQNTTVPPAQCLQTYTNANFKGPSY